MQQQPGKRGGNADCGYEQLYYEKTVKDLYLFASNLTFPFIFDRDRQGPNIYVVSFRASEQSTQSWGEK